MKKAFLVIIILMLALGLAGPWAMAGPPIGTKTSFIVDHDGNYLKIESDGAMPTRWQDPVEPPLVLYFTQALAAPTTLINSASLDDYDVFVTNAADFSSGNYIGLFSGVSGEGRFYFANITGISGAKLTLDTQLDFPYEAGDPIIPLERNMAVNGSSTSQEFCIQVGGANTPITIDITRVMIMGECSAAPELTDFCGIEGGLVRGLVLRKVDGETRNFWNVKSNLDLSNIAFDYTPYLAINPGQGVNGIAVRYTWAGPDKHGTAIRLEPADELCAIIQDNISTEPRLLMIAQGHIVL